MQYRKKTLRELMAECCDNCINWNYKDYPKNKNHPNLKPCRIKRGFPELILYTDDKCHCKFFERK